MENFSRFLSDTQREKDSVKQYISDEEHQRVLKSAVDVPEQPPPFALGINRVGIGNKSVWVLLPEGRIPFNIEIFVDLSASTRGIHMSRMEQAISALYTESFTDIGQYAEKLSQLISIGQNCTEVSVNLKGKIPLVHQTPVSQYVSIDSTEIDVKTLLIKRNQQTESSVKMGALINHITACPCTQVYFHELDGNNRKMPLLTHSQRSQTRLAIERQGTKPGYNELIDCLKTALHATYDLLKRQDEAETVLTAHLYPQFAEDAVRLVAKELGKKFANVLPLSTSVSIESRSYESIHTHDVLCQIDTRLEDIVKHLK